MAGSPRTQAPEIAKILDGQIVTAQMQQGIQQHRTVTIGQDQSVAIQPFGIGRIVTQKIVPQDGAKVGHAHRGTGVAGFRPLHRIHAQGANGVGQLPARGGGGCPNGGAGSGERRGHRIHHGASGQFTTGGHELSLLTVLSNENEGTGYAWNPNRQAPRPRRARRSYWDVHRRDR